MKSLHYAIAVFVVPLFGLCMAPGFAHAGGFALNEMSAASVGNAHAGAAAAEDASTVFYNPAGLSTMSGHQFSASLHAIQLSAKFRNQGSSTATGPLRGGNSGDAGGWNPVPAVFFATDLTPALRLGLGMHAPFGLMTEYDDDWVGRYQAIKSELKSVNLNPVLSYRVNDVLSLAGGLSAQYINVELSRAIDLGSVCAGGLGLAACAPGGFLPQSRDGKVTVKGNDWGYGFNLGVLFTPAPNTRIGATYRSRVRHRLSGHARFDVPAGLPAPLAASPALQNISAGAAVDLPELVSVHGFTQLDDKWSAMADMTWMRWSRFKELRVRFDNGAPDSVTPEEWRNTLRISAAVNYRYNDQWKLRSGIAHDPTPVKSALSTPRIPDADRTWLTIGAQYKPTRHSSVDLGYAHLFVKDSSLNKAEPPVGGTLTGKYKNYVNILSVQYNHAF